MHLEVFQLRLLVVEGLVVPVILGVDFLSRLSKVTFDFHEMKLLVSGSGETVKLLEDYNDVGHKLELYTHKYRNSCQFQLEVRCLSRVQREA